MIKYKLTNQKLQTYKGFQWEVGKWVNATGSITRPLCTDGWLHCYDSPLLAILHNPIHADIDNPKLFEVKVKGKCKTDNGLKSGFRSMCLIQELPQPYITHEQHIAYGILCARAVYSNVMWNKWADNWLLNKDRTYTVAVNAYVAADVAYVAAYVAHAAYAAAANAAAHAAHAAYAAANAAAYAAHAACAAANSRTIILSLVDIAKEAIKLKI